MAGRMVGCPMCRCVALIMVLAVMYTEVSYGRTWHVPGDVATIQGAIDASTYGDDVLVAPGTYYEHEIQMKAGIWVHSEEGASATTINANGQGIGFVCAGLAEQATIEGLRLVMGRAMGGGEVEGSGGGIRAIAARVMVRDCEIDGCRAEDSGGGVAAWDSDVAMLGCTIKNCSAGMFGGGICGYSGDGSGEVVVEECDVCDNRALSGGGVVAVFAGLRVARSVVVGNRATFGAGGGIGCRTESVEIRDSVIRSNLADEYYGGCAIYLEESSGVIEGCTVADNRAYAGGAVEMLGGDVEIVRSIVAFNIAASMRCTGAAVDVSCCDTYGNVDGDGLCGNDGGGNFSADPLFCDREQYAIDAISPCLPGNHPNGVDCGLIGALGQGCGVLPTGACCLPDGACTILPRSQCEEQEGTYQGDGSACEPNPCQPTAVEGTSWGRVRAAFR